MIDAVLAPKLNEFADKIGVKRSEKYKIRARGKGIRVGEYAPDTDEMKTVFYATESTVAHELGHAIDNRTDKVKEIVKAHPGEMELVAQSRYEGVNAPESFKKYCAQEDELVAELISAYVTNREWLRENCPRATKALTAFLKKSPFKDLVDMKPSRSQTVKKREETNWVMDNSILPDEDLIYGRREGKLVYYRVPLELALAVKNLHPQQLPGWLLTVFKPNNWLRAGATTLSPDFVFANPVRDQADVSYTTKAIPGVSLVSGAVSYIKNDKSAQAWIRRGGSIGSPESGIRGKITGRDEAVYGNKWGRFVDPEYWQDHGILETTMDFLGYAASRPFQPLMNLAQLTEVSTRIGVLKAEGKVSDTSETAKRDDYRNATYEHAMNDEELYKRREAILQSREGSLDFDRIGYNMRIPAQVIPFLNPMIQGIDKMYRGAHDDPKKALLYAAYMLFMYAGLHAWNRLNQHYKEISAQEKADNFIVMLGTDGMAYMKFPKGHIQRFVVNPFQKGVEIADGQTTEKAWSAAADLVMSALPFEGTLPMPVPMKLMLEPIVNYDFYWRKEIEKPYLRSLPANYRSDNRTSAALKKLGLALRIHPEVMRNEIAQRILSPAMQQHMIRTTFGGGGTSALALVDYALGKAGYVEDGDDWKPEKGVITRRFYGVVEDWKSDLAAQERMVLKRIREIDGMRKDIRSSMLYAGMKPEQAIAVATEMKKEAAALVARLKEIRDAMEATKELQQ